MKFLLAALFMAMLHISFGQSVVQENTFFAQGIYPTYNVDAIKELESEIRSLPFVKIVRLDINTSRFFILTKDIDQLDELTLRSWFSEKGNGLTCIQIGVYGTDAMNPYPFVNCQN
ncbi:MAG: hypothetical protein ACSHXL_01040 [Bacteroidota bacterium]